MKAPCIWGFLRYYFVSPQTIHFSPLFVERQTIHLLLMKHKHTNQLIHETSPYLLQHAHNPVNWYPWGDEALKKARDEDKPILVSIGYAACHWCHVMERESFENEATADIMNQLFINIKIDREERPDLDHIYMDAVQAMSGSGGWPLNVFLTPESKPFFGGTYFPPERAFNRASWKEILMGVSKGYQEKKAEILSQAENLTEHLLTSNAFGMQKPDNSLKQSLFSGETLHEMTKAILGNADRVWGGFGNAPKFPQTFSIQYLLRQYHFTKDTEALEQAILSIDKMIDGGIYDQIGGGFARYSTDNEWLAPHFEKMLYDNALLIGVLAEAFQLTKNPRYSRTIHQTIAFIERELESEEGGFYCALDADSEGVEGKFYTWQYGEVEEILGRDAATFCAYFDISKKGNWEHTNILRVLEPIAEFAKKQQISEKVLDEMLLESGEKLLKIRSQRIRPQLDDKILLGWNALMNVAYCKAYAAIGDESFKEKAISNMNFLEKVFKGKDGNWFHTYKGGKAKIAAFLDDYAYLINAYIHLQEITGKGEYLQKARVVTEWVICHFVEESTGFFYYTHNLQKDVIVRKKEVYDGAVPSGNAVMVHNLLYLSIVFDKKEWNDRSRDLLVSLGNAILKHPGSFGIWATAVQSFTHGMMEIAITGQRAKEFLSPLLQRYLPNKIIQAEETNSLVFPLLAGKTGLKQTGPAFYLCKNYACSAPFLSLETLLANV